MAKSELQLLVHGKDIAESTPFIEYKGVEIRKIHKTDNPNYLFIDLNIHENTVPGKFIIGFKNNGTEIHSYSYELRQRVKNSASRKGFGRQDVIYLLMPDRFANGDPANDDMPGMKEKSNRENPDGRHGGDIKGIVNHLDYIAELGFTALWINPLVENNNPKYSYHGYAITDFYKIDPRYGTNDEYIELVNSCHQKGIKVIMDMIFNHSSLYHWLIQDLPEEDWIHQYPEFTRTNYRASCVVDPYVSDYDKEKMVAGWFDQHMPDLDQRNVFLSNYLIQNSIWWIEMAGLDGIRVDTQPYPYKEFITQWGKRIFEEYPDFNVVGEAWLREEAFTAYFQKDSWNVDQYNSNLPCVTDFPMHFALEKAFHERDGWTEGLARLYYVLAHDFLYADPFNTLIFPDNHDLTRFFTLLGENQDKFRMGIAFILTTRGIPMIYYGTEILMTGNEHQGHGYIRQDFPGGWRGDEINVFERKGLTNDQSKALDYMTKLLNWRKNCSAIHTGKLKQFVPENELYVYFKFTEDDCVMIILNNSDTENKSLNTNRFQECMNGYSSARNIITDEIISDLEMLEVPKKSALILELSK